MSSTIIAGIDEAGRGALAGPVVAAACVFEQKHDFVADSKALTKEEREEAFAFLAKSAPFGIGVVEHSFIDSDGILAATEKAMQLAVADLSTKVQPTYLLIDGRDKFWFDLPHSSVIRGDESEVCISAASIIAKVTRDRLMVKYDESHPGYEFALHKGYGTDLHRQILGKNGPCPLHRLTFLSKMNVVQTPSGAFSK